MDSLPEVLGDDSLGVGRAPVEFLHKDAENLGVYFRTR
jgi:hypothetical protein